MIDKLAEKGLENFPADGAEAMAAYHSDAIEPLVDRYGRIHDSLRLSVTDRCNIRCFYCMPAGDAAFAPRESLLTFEELHRLASALVRRCGVRELRITGGEPLLRRDLDVLVGMLASIPGLMDLSLTTNGMLLAGQAVALRRAGLKRLNISLDTVDEQTFQKITRRAGVARVVKGIDAAIAAGFESVKLNALAIAGITEQELVSLVEFARARDVVLRFIEFMPLDSDGAWELSQVLTGDRLLALLERHFGKVRAQPRRDPSQPAEEFLLPGGGVIGLIRSVTAPFCRSCNRLRITADGAVRNCLFSTRETPLREMLRGGADDADLIAAVRACVAEKRAGHGIDEPTFLAPERPMYAIGG